MDDASFECPHCGAKVYPEMTRCPNCGQSMYPEDEAPDESVQQGDSQGVVALLGALLIGWMIAGGVAMLVHLLTARFVSPAAIGTGSVILFIVAAALGAGVGAYVAAGIFKRGAWWLGVAVGALALPLSALLATHWVQVDMAFLLTPLVLAASLLILLAGAAGGWLNRGLAAQSGWQEKFRLRGWEDLLYQDLLRKVRFNGSVADRLIEYERCENPQASRLQLIQNAIEHWERDNR